MITEFPNRYSGCASATRPAAAAATGAPPSAAMSVPPWVSNGAPLTDRWTPKPFDIGPRAGCSHGPDHSRCAVNVVYVSRTVWRSAAIFAASDSRSMLSSGTDSVSRG
jgi:hypothetical protein